MLDIVEYMECNDYSSGWEFLYQESDESATVVLEKAYPEVRKKSTYKKKRVPSDSILSAEEKAYFAKTNKMSGDEYRDFILNRVK